LGGFLRINQKNKPLKRTPRKKSKIQARSISSKPSSSSYSDSDRLRCNQLQRYCNKTESGVILYILTTEINIFSLMFDEKKPYILHINNINILPDLPCKVQDAAYWITLSA
jgi:hypothetical protein